MELEDVVANLAPTGTLRASINLGNPVLAQGSPEAPEGVSVDIARALGSRLGVPVELICFGAALDAFEATNQGRADLCFLAVDPARAETVAFTEPYALIEGVFVVRDSSPFISAAEVDRAGVRVGVKTGSAYDLFLSRTLAHAEVIRGSEGTSVFLEQQLEAAAGIRQPMRDFVEEHADLRLLEPRFMEIRQAVGVARGRGEDTARLLGAFVEELKASGFVAEALGRSGRSDAVVAPPAG